ncbi:MAG TPA: hypothetical protein VNF47_12685 [Streptosporangiaceae bacterium]|nr:hypothetical protein [Streptosporangiaceae bacterium]
MKTSGGHQPPVEPLVVECVAVGVGAGAGVLGGGASVAVGRGAGAAADRTGRGAVVVLALGLVWRADGLADGLAPGLALGAGEPFAVDVVATVEWLNRFMKPTTPTALSSVARQVSVDSLRSPSSRRALSRSRCLMGA